eukprot:TRINITY_DN1136_c0_g1_i2.p1 TRINITY_DN1136_c0_g1~~TRINITY_DN1136_c0_g1_i2.p1  ORF type:complete len:106 (+),score=4.58 TRINITY_DN1136_c0_g1_i2:111-428(+)
MEHSSAHDHCLDGTQCLEYDGNKSTGKVATALHQQPALAWPVQARDNAYCTLPCNERLNGVCVRGLLLLHAAERRSLRVWHQQVFMVLVNWIFPHSGCAPDVHGR